MILEGSTDTLAFERYIEQVFAPSLRHGQVVVMDNLSAHTSPKVRQAIEAMGCQLRFLPSYSPDLSPECQGLSPNSRLFCAGSASVSARTCIRRLETLWIRLPPKTLTAGSLTAASLSAKQEAA